MATQTIPAIASAHTAPVPASWSMPGTITNTDEAGVVTDSVRNSTPATPSERVSACGGVGCNCPSSIQRPPRPHREGW